MPTLSGDVPKTGIPRLDELVELCEAHGSVMQVAPCYRGAGWQVDVTLYASDPFMADVDTEVKARRWLAAKALALLDAVARREVGRSTQTPASPSRLRRPGHRTGRDTHAGNGAGDAR